MTTILSPINDRLRTSEKWKHQTEKNKFGTFVKIKLIRVGYKRKIRGV